MQIDGCQESPLPAECSSLQWGAALRRNMWELVTESCSSGQTLDTVRGLYSCRQGVCEVGAGKIRMEGPHAWSFKGMPMPVRSDLCVQDVPGA